MLDNKHLAVYDKFIGNTSGRRGRLCELTGTPGADIHHIRGRDCHGANEINNLMALAPDAHEFFGQKKQFLKFLEEVHDYFLETKEALYLRDPWNPTMLLFLDSTKKSLYFNG